MSDEVLDLDAAKAARDDAESTPLPVVLGGKTYQVARPLSAKAIIAAREEDLATLADCLFGDDAEEILDSGIDYEQVRLVLRRLVGGQGNSNASSG